MSLKMRTTTCSRCGTPIAVAADSLVTACDSCRPMRLAAECDGCPAWIASTFEGALRTGWALKPDGSALCPICSSLMATLPAEPIVVGHPKAPLLPLSDVIAPAPAEGHVQDDPGLRDLSLALAAYIDHYLDAHPDAAPSDMAAGIVEWLSRAGNTLGNGDPGVWGMKVYRNIVERRQAQQEALRLRRDLDDANRELTAATSLVARQVVRIDRLQDELTRLRAQLQDATEENLKLRAEMTPQALDRLWSAIVGHPTDQDDDATRGDQQP